MIGIVLAFAHTIFHAFSNVLDSHISNNIFTRPTSITYFNNFTNLLIIPFLLLISMPVALSLNTVIVLLIVAMIEVLYQIPYYRALQKMDTSIVVALFYLGQIIVPVMAYFLVDEKLSPIKYIGFFIVIFSAIILSLENVKKLKINGAFYLMLLCSFMLSAQIVLMKYVLIEMNWVSTIIYMMLFSFALSQCFLLAPAMRRDIVPGFKKYFKNIHLFIGTEFMTQMGSIIGIIALSMIPVVYFESIDATQPIAVLIISLISGAFMGKNLFEKNNRTNIIKKTVCFALIAMGVYLVIA